MRIFLTGFMGSGKSTLGVILANVLGLKFIDLDKRISEETHKSITALFKEHGEAHFRTLETAYLQQFGQMENVLLSLGGGTLANQTNLDWAKQHGVVIYLSLSVPNLVERLKHSTTRPLILDDAGKPLSAEALAEKIAALLMPRLPFYEQAHLVISLDGVSIGGGVDLVVETLRKNRFIT